MRPVSVGILGFAHGHVGAYCGRWRERPEMGVRVVAGWDHDEARAADSCAKFGAERAPSAQALLERRDVDAVVIGAETSLHADLVEAAAAPARPSCSRSPSP